MDIILAGRSVCIVDDDSLFRLHLSTLLGQARLRTTEAADGHSLNTVLEKEMPDCILLDYNLDSENGFRLHEQLKLRFPNLAPVIMLSADESQRTAIKAFRMGLYDFLPKRNLRIEEITSAVRKSLAKQEAEKARQGEISLLRKTAMLDDLTGMYSPEELRKKLQLLTSAVKRSGTRFAILSICLAEYRKISASLGVKNADDVLRGFAGRLRANLRAEDFCGRYDEDTFHYVMDRNPSPDGLQEQMERFKEQLTFSHHIKSVELTISPLIAFSISGVDGDSVQMLQHLSAELDAQRDARGLGDKAEDWSSLPAATQAGDGTKEPAERRRSVRMRTLKPAFIALEEWSSKINCTVRNISEGGARIRLERPLALPEFFLLKIGTSGQLRRVRKCWHINDEIGVEFCDETK
jgi:two-component system cell cycle response regulator